MATIPEVWKSLRGELDSVLNVGAPPLVAADQIFIDNPPSERLAMLGNGKQPAPCVALFDLKFSRNATRWPAIQGQTVVDSEVTAELSNELLPEGTSQTITVTHAAIVGDCITVMFQNQTRALSASATFSATATVDQAASALADAVNNSPDLVSWVNAVAVGPVVTINNIGAYSLSLGVETGNSGQVVTELARIIRPCQIVLWTKTIAERDLISPIIYAKLARMQNRFGFKQNDNTVTRLTLNSDLAGRDDKNPNVYRWIWIVDLEIGITTVDAVAQILGFKLTKNLSYNPIVSPGD